MAPMSATRPIRVGTRSFPVALPVETRSTRARMGIPSFAKMFQIPETRIDNVTDGAENPHDMSIA